MLEKIKKNGYLLSWLLIIILSIIVIRLLKLYDICCTILTVVSPILFGYIFAWVLKPPYYKLAKKIGNRLAIGLFIALSVLIYCLVIWYLFPIILENAKSLVDISNAFIDKISSFSFLEDLKKYKTLDVSVLIDSCNNLLSFLGIFGLIHIFGFYMLYNYEQINSFLRKLIPLKYKRITLEYIRKLSSNMRLYIKGTLIDTFILFVISSILYAIIGLKYPIFLAAFSALTNIIPFIGPYIGGIPAVLVGLASSIKLGIITLGCIVFAQTVESNIINPYIMSKCIKVNPLLIVIALTVMGKFLGLLGMIFAVPTIIILKLTYDFLCKYKKIGLKES